MELKALSPVLLSSAVAKFEGNNVSLKGETLKNLLKEALIYENLREDKKLFDEFYKKLLWWKEFAEENKENLKEVRKQLQAVAFWLEKKVLCGGEPEIVNGEVVNYEEEKNLLNLLKVSDFPLKAGNVFNKKIKLVGKAKRFIGVRKAADVGSVFEGTFEVDNEKLTEYEKHAQKPVLYEVFKENRLLEVVNRFSLKVLEADKEFFADRGYSDIVRRLEDIEADSNEKLVRVNYKGGILPFGAELFIYERIEKGEGRKEEKHLSEIMQTAYKLARVSELFTETREKTVDRYPIGWLRFE
jgi:hypothetical protein